MNSLPKRLLFLLVLVSMRCVLLAEQESHCSPDSLRSLIESSWTYYFDNPNALKEVKLQATCILDNNLALSPVDSGFLELSQDNYRKALDIFSRFTDADVGEEKGVGYSYLAITHYALARNFHLTGESDSSTCYLELVEADIDSGLAYGYTDASWWLLGGGSCFLSGDFETALTFFDSALSARPGWPEAWRSKAFTYNAIGQYENGLICADSAIRYDRDYGFAWVAKAASIGMLVGFDHAIPFFDSALARQRDLHEAWANKCMCLTIIGEYEEALSACDSALVYRRTNMIYSNLSKAWINRAISLWRLGRGVEALANCDSALVYEPDSPRLLKARKRIADSLNVH
jgi:tetratricopeptide (TPR) repeat protein